MDITVLYVEDCPHVGLARQRIAEALVRVGTTATTIERMVRSRAGSQDTEFHGSPTILVDGADAFATDGAIELSCRLYPTESGLQGAPSVDQLVEAITR